jgi:hypothetical protein
MRVVGEALQKQKAPILIAHERLIYFMQALALHHGLDEGPDPKWRISH